jgi:hypothetical protein
MQAITNSQAILANHMGALKSFGAHNRRITITQTRDGIGGPAFQAVCQMAIQAAHLKRLRTPIRRHRAMRDPMNNRKRNSFRKERRRVRWQAIKAKHAFIL